MCVFNVVNGLDGLDEKEHKDCRTKLNKLEEDKRKKLRVKGELSYVRDTLIR